MVWHVTTHDMTWNGTADMDFLMIWKSQALLLLCIECMLDNVFISTSTSLVIMILQWSQVSSCDHKLVSLLFLSVDQLAYSTTKMYFIMFPLFFISPWYDKVHAYAIHSWRDDISLKRSWTKIVHIDPLSELNLVTSWERGLVIMQLHDSSS